MVLCVGDVWMCGCVIISFIMGEEEAKIIHEGRQSSLYLLQGKWVQRCVYANQKEAQCGNAL